MPSFNDAAFSRSVGALRAHAPLVLEPDHDRSEREINFSITPVG
jgi:hypothetical protein